jgi:hypothetical protein
MTDRDPQWGVFVQGAVMAVFWAALITKIMGIW